MVESYNFSKKEIEKIRIKILNLHEELRKLSALIGTCS